MIPRPTEELVADYGSTIRALGEAGYYTRQLYEADGLLFSTRPDFARESNLQLAVRQRGKFLHGFRRATYVIPGEIEPASLCVQLLRGAQGLGPLTLADDHFFHGHGLRNTTNWEEEEYNEQAERFRSNGWAEVDPEEKAGIWSIFETMIAPEQQQPPAPSIVWDIGTAYEEDLSMDTEPDLTLKALGAMRAVSKPDDVWYVFSDYASLSGFLPWRASPKPYSNWWMHPVLPRGAPPYMKSRTNHNCFVRHDFRAGFLTYLREDSLCIFGQDLLDALAADPPALLTKVRRRDGVPVLPSPLRRDLGVPPGGVRPRG
jgi:hypothetical protein